MAITYTPQFAHEDWIDNVDRVQAGGPNGFNIRFNGISDEFATLSTVVTTIDSAIANGPRLRPLPAPSLDGVIQVVANGASPQVQVDQYRRSDLPTNTDKVYFAVILYRSGSTNIRHTFLHSQESDLVAVKIQFFNHDSALTAQFSCRIMTFTL